MYAQHPHLFVGQQPTTALYSSSLLVQEGLSFCIEGIIFSQSRMHFVKTVELFIRTKSRIVLISRVVSLGYRIVRLYALKRIEALLQEWERWRQRRQKEADIRKLLAVLKSMPMEKKTYLRPLSPHLPIYKPQLTSTFPISHRISGAFLATIVLFFYLLCMKIGLICFTYKNFYQFFFFSSKLILISVEITALALSYHLFNGVRHLLTDFSGFLFLRIGRKRLK